MTKERLRQYLALKEEKKHLQQQLETVEAALLSPKVQKLTGMPHSPGNGSGQDELMLKHIELQAAYTEMLEYIAGEQLAIETAAAALPPVLRTLIRLHYFEGQTWDQVCQSMHYSWTHVHRLHREALRLLREQEDITCE